MKELLLELQPIIYQAVIVVLTTLGTYLGAKAKNYIDYNKIKYWTIFITWNISN